MLFINNKHKQYHNYVSDIDALLSKLDKELIEKASSRIAEEKKYNKIHFLRDHADDRADDSSYRS